MNGSSSFDFRASMSVKSSFKSESFENIGNYLAESLIRKAGPNLVF